MLGLRESGRQVLLTRGLQVIPLPNIPRRVGKFQE
jgi:hypothetical protein